jgi:hypothetical protein
MQTGDSFTRVLFLSSKCCDSFKTAIEEMAADTSIIQKLGSKIDCILINKDTRPLHLNILSFVMDTNKFIPRNIPIVIISSLSEKE